MPPCYEFDGVYPTNGDQTQRLNLLPLVPLDLCALCSLIAGSADNLSTRVSSAGGIGLLSRIQSYINFRSARVENWPLNVVLQTQKGITDIVPYVSLNIFQEIIPKSSLIKTNINLRITEVFDMKNYILCRTDMEVIQ